MIKLSANSLELLIKCVKTHNPSLLALLQSNDDFSEDFYNELRHTVGDEFCAKGLQPDSEPNEYGLELEALIDEIGRLFM